MSTKYERALSAASNASQTRVDTFGPRDDVDVTHVLNCQHCGQSARLSNTEDMQASDLAARHLQKRSRCGTVEVLDAASGAVIETVRRQELNL